MDLRTINILPYYVILHSGQKYFILSFILSFFQSVIYSLLHLFSLYMFKHLLCLILIVFLKEFLQSWINSAYFHILRPLNNLGERFWNEELFNVYISDAHPASTSKEPTLVVERRFGMKLADSVYWSTFGCNSLSFWNVSN